MIHISVHLQSIEFCSADRNSLTKLDQHTVAALNIFIDHPIDCSGYIHSYGIYTTHRGTFYVSVWRPFDVFGGSVTAWKLIGSNEISTGMTGHGVNTCENNV